MKTRLRFFSIVLTTGMMLLARAIAADAPALKKEEKVSLPYRITHGDRIAVAVFNEPDLTSGGNKVEARGTISLQLIAEIRIAGLTVVEAQAAIESAYRDQRYLRNPQVKVTVEEYAARLVNISGKVNQQG